MRIYSFLESVKTSFYTCSCAQQLRFTDPILCAVFAKTWQLFGVFWLMIWTASAVCYLTGSVYVIELLGDQNREWAMSVR